MSTVLPALVTRSLRENRRSAIGWAVGLAAVVFVYVGAYGQLKTAAAAKEQLLPEAMKKIFGMTDLTSGAGYLETTVFALVGPLLLIMCAVIFGARTIAGPESSGTIDLLLANPISRGQFVWQRVGAFLLAFLQDETYRREFVEDLLHGRGDLGRIADRAERLGVRLAASHLVAVVRHREEPFTTDLAHRIDVGLSDRFGSHNALVAARDGQLVCIAASGLIGIPGELSHRLVTNLGVDVRWRIAIGRAHAGPSGIVQSYEEALDALDLADRLGYAVPVLKADDLLVFRVLLRDREAMVDLVETVLGPLLSARAGPEPLLQTLSVLFDHQGNITATARHLNLSARAVTYRLERVEQLTGYKATETTQRFTLEAAVLGARLLRWPPDPHA